MMAHLPTLDNTDIRRLQLENDSLSEELAQCQADKEFVWSLWKRLQVTSPDVTQAIGLVVQKEKESSELKDRKVLQLLQGDRLAELQKLVTTQSQELGLTIAKKNETQKDMEQMKATLASTAEEKKLLQDKIVELESRVSDQQLISREQYRDLERERDEIKELLKQKSTDLQGFETDKKDLGAIREAQRDRIRTLEADLEDYKSSCKHYKQQLEKEIENTEEYCKDSVTKQEELEAVRKELGDLWQTHQKSLVHNKEQGVLIEQLQSLQTDTHKALANNDSARSIEVVTMRNQITELSTKYQLLQNSERELKVWIAQYKQRISLQEKQLAETKQRLEQLTLTKHSGSQTLMDSRLMSLQQEVEELKNQQQFSSSKPISTSSPHESRTRSRSVGHRSHSRSRSYGRSRSEEREQDEIQPTDDDVYRKLEFTEKKLNDTKQMLDIKCNEVNELRRAHSQRLERLRSLQKSHALVKKELKIMDEDKLSSNNKPKKKKKLLSHVDPRTLQDENSETVWNELTYFKKQSKNLSVENMNLSEELDTLRVQRSQDAATIHELSACLQQEREELELICAQQEEKNVEFDNNLLADLKETADKVLHLESQLSDVKQQHRETHEVNKGLKHQVDKLSERVQELIQERDDLCNERRKLRSDLAATHQHLSERRIEISDLNGELHGLQKELRNKKRPSSKGKMSVSKKYQKILNKSIRTMSDMFDEFQQDGWEEIHGDSTDITKTTEETLTPRDTTDSFGGTGTTDSLGLAIAECARSQNHSQSKIDAQYVTPMNLHSRTLNHLNRCGQSDSETISSASVVPYKQSTDSTITRDVALSPINTPSTSLVSATWTSGSSVHSAKGSKVISSAQVKAMRQRVHALQREVTIFRSAKHAAQQRDLENRNHIEQLQADLQLANQKLHATKNANQRVTSELSRVRSEKDSLETHLRELEENTVSCDSQSTHTEQEWNAANYKIKTLSNDVSKQLQQIKHLKIELNQATEKLASVQEKVHHQDRDLSQKRALVDDIRLKLKIAQENAQSDADVMLEAENKIGSLADVNHRLKTQIESFRKRLSAVTKDKQSASLHTIKLSDEIERKSKQLSDLQVKHRQLQSEITRLDTAAQTQLHAVASQSEAAIDTAQQQLQRVNAQNVEYQKFVKVLSHTLINSIQQARVLLKQQKSKKVSAKCDDPALVKARQKACDILNLGQEDLEELMSGKEKSDPKQDIETSQEIRNDKRWMRKWEKLLFQKKENFAVSLVEIVMEKVNDRIELGQKLYEL